MADESRTEREEAALNEPLPADISRHLEEAVGSGEPVRLSVSTDLDLEGRFATGWLVATDRDLVSLQPNGGAPHVTRVPLADIEGIKLRDLVGGGVIKVRAADGGHTLARFSKSRTADLAPLPRRLEEMVRRAQPEADLPERIADSNAGRGGQRGQRCRRCGGLISRRRGVCMACLDTRRLLTRLLSYAKPHWKLATFSLLLMLGGTLIGLSPPLLLGLLIDEVLAPDRVAVAATTAVPGELPASDSLAPANADTLTAVPLLGEFDREGLLKLLVLTLLLVHVVQSGLGALRSYVLAHLGQRVTFGMRNQVYSHLNLLSLNFYNTRETGRIMASITQDVGRLQDFISDGLQEVIRDVLTVVGICVILFSINPSLAALVLLPTPLLVFTTLGFSRKLHTIYRGLWRRSAAISSLLADTIPGVRVVKAFAQERREVGKFEDRSGALMHGELRAARLRSVFSPTMSFITSLGTMIIWWVGGHKVLGGELALGLFVTFTGYMWRFYGPVESLCRLNHRFQRAATSAERVFETLDAEPDVADTPGVGAMPPIDGRVEFRDVDFSYDDGKPVLKNMSFTVEPGEMIGLAGHSGAGKSTLINLIARFYDVDGGAILIDGTDIRAVGLKSLRDQVGVVLQDPFLFNASVADNIAYGSPGAEPERVVAAAKAAHAHEFIIELPDGYDTMVGERGTRLSGGERQRLSIARAILRDPRILILDEATSSVDTETEVKIQQALERLIQGRTTFAIAHRLSTLRHANRLLIIENGELAEMGTHDELVEKGGTYANLVRMQSELAERKAIGG